ncbi:MAG TPA: hypothetical protein VHX13_14165 [Acidobacteriaceae bacterium]|jgi:hypothetical protein|nr:hypothetical protein [Acidobacteriaceae bacterium]
MKVEYQLTVKNGLSIITGVCVVLLAVIPLKVAPDRLLLLRWEIAIIGLAAVAVISLLYQGHLQSRDDHEQTNRNKRIDESLALLAPSGKQREMASSNPLVRNTPHTPGTFDSKEFFRTAFYSALQDVAANSFRVEAERVRPGDTAAFYLDVLAVGFMAVFYDNIWWPLYRSQLRALLDLSGRNGIIPVVDFRRFYEDAAREFSSEYKEFSITAENWTNYMANNSLVIIHPSQMVEITVMGKDFLKYLLHLGRSESTKRL